MVAVQGNRRAFHAAHAASDSDLWAAHVRLAKRHEPDDVDLLARAYDGYACGLAHRMGRGAEPSEDLRQVAREALLHALYRFEPGRGVPFTAYARPTIVGSLRRHYRDRGWLIHVPRSVHDRTVAARITTERLRAGLGRNPTNAEVASDLGITDEALLTCGAGVAARNTQSLDSVSPTGAAPLVERIGSEDPSLRLVEDLTAVASALHGVALNDRLLLRLYFLEDLTQAEVGHRLGISQMQVSRRLAVVLGQLRRRTGTRETAAVPSS